MSGHILRGSDKTPPEFSPGVVALEVSLLLHIRLTRRRVILFAVICIRRVDKEYNSIRRYYASMTKERYQTRLPADKAERLEQFKQERGISNAEAMRRMVDRGLEKTAAESQPAETADDLEQSQSAEADRALVGDGLDAARQWLADPLNSVLAVLVAAFTGTIAAQAGMTVGAAIRNFVAIIGGF